MTHTTHTQTTTWRDRVNSGYARASGNALVAVLLSTVFIMVVYWNGFNGTADRANWLSWTLFLSALSMGVAVLFYHRGHFIKSLIFTIVAILILAIKNVIFGFTLPADWNISADWMGFIIGLSVLTLVVTGCIIAVMAFKAHLAKQNPPT